MKRLLFITSILLLLTTCSDDEKKEIHLHVSQKTLNFTAQSEEKTIEIKANDTWQILTIPQWINIDKTSGENDYTLKVTAIENALEEPRTATITIQSHDKSASIEITQNAKNIEISLSKDELIFEDFEEEKGIAIISNDEWTITGQEYWTGQNYWFSINKEKGYGNDSLYIKVENLFQNDEREATLTIECRGRTRELLIKQIGKEQHLNLSTIVVEYDTNSSSKVIEIQSNSKWEIETQDTWYKVDKTSGTGNAKLTISVEKNSSKQYRNGKIKIKNARFEKYIYVKQEKIQAADNSPYQFNFKDHAMRAGDNFVKKQVEHIDEGPAGENIIWDFSKLTLIESNYSVRHESAPCLLDEEVFIMGYNKFPVEDINANSLIVKTEHNTMYYYQYGEDGLLHALGHENPVTKLQYEPDMIMGKSPTYYQNTYKIDYESNGRYSGTEPIAYKGNVEMIADAYGKIKFSNGVVVDNVIRVTYKQLIIDNIRNENMEIVEDRKLLITTQWYAKGYRYPVFETIRNIKETTNELLFATAFYFPPAMHYQYMNKSKSSTVEVVNNKLLLDNYEKYKFKE